MILFQLSQLKICGHRGGQPSSLSLFCHNIEKEENKIVLGYLVLGVICYNRESGNDCFFQILITAGTLEPLLRPPTTTSASLSFQVFKIPFSLILHTFTLKLQTQLKTFLVLLFATQSLWNVFYSSLWKICLSYQVLFTKILLYHHSGMNQNLKNKLQTFLLII